MPDPTPIPDDVLRSWAGKSTPNGPGILSTCAGELLAEREWRKMAQRAIRAALPCLQEARGRREYRMGDPAVAEARLSALLPEFKPVPCAEPVSDAVLEDRERADLLSGETSDGPTD